MKNISNTDFSKSIYDIYKDEYTLLSKYQKSDIKLKVKHNICNTIFEILPSQLKNGKNHCPYCNPKSKLMTIDVFKRKLDDKYNGEYSIVGNFVNMSTKIKIRHNNCCCEKGFYEWDVEPCRILKGRQCPCESHQQKYTIKDFERRMNIYHQGWKLAEDAEYINSSTPVNIICENNHHICSSLDNIKNGCIYCTGQKAIKGVNDIFTTNKYIFDCLKNKDDGYLYKVNTSSSLCFVCPRCKKEIYKKPSVAFNKHSEFICECSDGISYPEKFTLSLLKQLNIDYIFQLDKKTFSWCNKYRYDFYLPSINTIIEVNGLQHYEEVKSWNSYNFVVENDRNKIKLAHDNNVNIIVIDARFSEKDFLKQSFINSELSKLINLCCVDFDICNKEANSSLLYETCEMWNNYDVTIQDISRKYGIHDATVFRYLESGNDMGICKFNKKEYKANHINTRNPIQIKCVETGEIFDSINKANIKYKIKLSSSDLDNHFKTKGGYHWITYKES